MEQATWGRRSRAHGAVLLIAIGAPEAGGEFTHATHSYAHAVRHGAIWLRLRARVGYRVEVKLGLWTSEVSQT